MTNTTAIQRLREFVAWAKSQGLCKSEHDFARQCNLCDRYIANNAAGGKGNIGSEIMGRIVRVYPQLNLAWLCTGEGSMTLDHSQQYNNYREAYLAATKQIEALNNILLTL